MKDYPTRLKEQFEIEKGKLIYNATKLEQQDWEILKRIERQKKEEIKQYKYGSIVFFFILPLLVFLFMPPFLSTSGYKGSVMFTNALIGALLFGLHLGSRSYEEYNHFPDYFKYPHIDGLK